MAVYLLCLITALTLQARLSNGRRTFLSDFLVSLSGRSRKVDIRSMLLETRFLRILYGNVSSSDNSEHAPILLGTPAKGDTKALGRKVRLP